MTLHPKTRVQEETKQMDLTRFFLEQLETQAEQCRKVIERVPEGNNSWKPHEKSFALGHLTQLISWMPAWITGTLREPHIDLATAAG